MSDLETLVRNALADDRRRLTPPHDASRWVRDAARRQRRRNAIVGAAVASLLAVAAAGVLMPNLTDADANYVAGLPPANSGLLPWEPVQWLDRTDIESAVDAWSDQAADEPSGAVYVIAADVLRGTTVAVLQGITDDGVGTVAFLTRDEESADPWSLRDTVPLPDGDVEALRLPRGTITPLVVRVGTDPKPPSLVLAPEWRTARTSELGSQLVPASPGFGDEPQWLSLSRATEWWAPLRSPTSAQSPTTVALTHGSRGETTQVPVLELGDDDGLAALVASDLTLRVLPKDAARPEALDDVRTVAERLGIDRPMAVTVLSSGSGSFSVGNHDVATVTPTRTLFAQFESDGQHVLVAYAVQGDKEWCFSSRTLARDVTTLPFVGMGCRVQAAAGRRGGVQGNEMFARSFIDGPDRKTPVLDISVTLVRGGGQNATYDLPGGIPLGALEEATRPVRRYVFTAVETFDGTELKPWVWPGWGVAAP